MNTGEFYFNICLFVHILLELVRAVPAGVWEMHMCL